MLRRRPRPNQSGRCFRAIANATNNNGADFGNLVITGARVDEGRP